MVNVGTLYPLRSEYFALIETVSGEAWASGSPATSRALCDAIAAKYKLDVKNVESNVWRCLRALTKRHMYSAQPAPIGSKGLGIKSSPTSPREFNFTEPRVDACSVSLETVVAHYLDASDVADRAKSDLRSAIRFHFDLPTKCLDSMLLRRCAEVACDQIQSFPERFYLRATALPRALSEKAAKNFRSCIRAAMRRAAKDRVVPLVFPLYLAEDEWSLWLSRYFPLARDGATPGRTARRRQGWRDLASACKRVHGADVTPEAITRQMAQSAIDEVMRVQGRASCFIGQALNALANEHQVGPYVGPTELDAFLVKTPSGLQPSMYLRARDGKAGKSWPQFLDIVCEHGFPTSMLEYLEYYGTYITMPAGELLVTRGKYPKRRNSHFLTAISLAQRARALRLFLGIAVLHLKIPASELTPEVAFGARFEEIASALIVWWRARRDVLPLGTRGTGLAGGLKETIISAGMMAYSLYERRRHVNRVTVATRKTEKSVLLDVRREEAVQKDEVELATWNAYLESHGFSDVLDAMAREVSGAAEAGAPEFKDIRRVVANTPPAWWIKLLNHTLSAWRAEKRAGRTASWTYHKSVLIAFELGAYISTGCRNEELCLARLDIQARDLRTKRMISFRATDRKNRKAHSVLLQPVYVPDDLMAEYLDRSRPYFMRERQMANGTVECAKTHSYLLVNTTGVAHQVDAVDSSQQAASELASAVRVGSHGQFMAKALRAAARKAGMALPDRDWEFGLHCIRGACGYGIRVVNGLGAAANYLGDTEGTVESAYSAIDGKLVDSSALVAVDMTPRLSVVTTGHARATLPATGGDYTSELERVFDRFVQGTINDVEAKAAREVLRAKYDLGGAARTLRAS